MNIIYIVYELLNSGPENVLYDIITNLDRLRFNPIIVTLRPETEGKSIEYKFRLLNVEIRKFSFSMFQMELRTKWVARQIETNLTDLKDYIIHVHGHHPNLIAACMKHTTIATIHNISREDFVMKKGEIIGGYMAWRHNHNLKLIDYPIAISNYMAQYYAKYANDNLSCIYNGVGIESSYEDKYIVRKRIGLEADDYSIVVIGSVSLRKNTRYVIEQLHQSRQKYKCLIVGSGSELELCRLIASGDNRFRFEGFKQDVSDYLNTANLCISASLSEGFPLSILEAINVGVPVLMSDIHPHKEIEKAMSLNSVRTYSLSAGELLSAFETMKELSFDIPALQEKSKELFSSKTMTEHYMKLYETVK